MLENGRFAIGLEGMIDLDHGMSGLLDVDGYGNWHLQEKKRRRKATSVRTTGEEGQKLWRWSRGLRRGLKGLEAGRKVGREAERKWN